MKKETKLDDKTPHWFTDWHHRYFMPVHDRTKRNEKWIVIIITAIIASGLLSNGNTEPVVSLLKAFFS